MFRLILESEFDVVREIYRETVQKLAVELYTKEQVKAWSNSPNNKTKFHEFIFKPKTYVYEKNNKIIAFCGLEEDGHIASLYVHPDFSRQGYGTKILQFVLEKGINSGIKKFYAEASFLSQPVFARCDFRILEMETVKYGNVSFDRYKMIKNV